MTENIVATVVEGLADIVDLGYCCMHLHRGTDQRTDGKCNGQSGSTVCGSFGGGLTSTTDTTKSIVHARTTETNHTHDEHLEHWAIVANETHIIDIFDLKEE